MDTIAIVVFYSCFVFGTITSDVVNHQTKTVNNQASSTYEELKK